MNCFIFCFVKMLRLVRVDDFLLGKSLKFFSYDYTDRLREKPDFEESVVGRYLISTLISKKFKVSNFIPQIDEDGIPIQSNSICWSLSHKKGHVLIGVERKRIGVDLEIYKDRDVSLLNKFSIEEWEMVGEKNLKYFYLLWTAKESLIKYLYLGIDSLDEIQTISISTINEKIDGLKFNKEISLSYAGKEFVALSGTNKGLFYSFTV